MTEQETPSNENQEIEVLVQETSLDANQEIVASIQETSSDENQEVVASIQETSSDVNQETEASIQAMPLNENQEIEVLVQETSLAIEAFENAESASEAMDYEHFTKADFITLLNTNLAAAKAESAKPSDYKRIDETLKEVKPLFDQMKRAEREIARQKYVSENENDEGFEYKQDEQSTQFETLYREIKDLKNKFFQDLDKNKEKNFASKTELLQRLRELVDSEEKNTKSQEASWNEFKKIQDDWKNAGNMVSPHNSTLWATYNALIDRFYSNRNIYFELKELDRKKNGVLKLEIVQKVEALSKSLEGQPLNKAILDEATHLFDEYKHIGPASKAEQEVLWERMKMALDGVHDARRVQSGEQKQLMAEVYLAKSKVYEALIPLTSFQSASINDWNDKSKEVTALQVQWTAIKAPMMRDEGKELSNKFWAALKTFFNNKGEFFRQLEAKREQHLKEKIALCEQAEAIVATAEDSGANTDKVIALQKQWKLIGQVPEKVKNRIYDRFKKACDAYFDQKRTKNLAAETEFLDNLSKKRDLCSRIEALSISGSTSMDALNGFKAEWTNIGFVPRKDMQDIQKRYIDAINGYVRAIGKLSSKEKEEVLLANEVQMSREGGNGSDASRGLLRKEGDIRRKMTQIENDLGVWQNNIEFFARSKNSDKLRADFDKKIQTAQKQLDDLKRQLKIMIAAN